MFGFLRGKGKAAAAEEVPPLNKRWDPELPREVEVTADWRHLLADGPEAACVERVLDLDAFTQQVLAPAECEALVAEAERVGFGRTGYPKAYRGNLRLIATDAALAAALWGRIAPHIPATQTDEAGAQWDACGLNECFRLAKYFPGDEFGAHCDAAFKRDGERSMYTVNIYLNGGFSGGATRFYDGNGGRGSRAPIHSVQPTPGLACMFRQPPEQAYLHDGERLHTHVKYLLRTDVMYRRRE